MEDYINHPSHYNSGGIECFDVILASQGIVATMDYCICNAQKYIFRHKEKGGTDDISKARWYINKWLELREECTDDEFKRYLA